MFSADECPKLSAAGEILTIDAAAFCGCPNTSTPSVCSLCGDGEVVRTDVDLGAYTCSELAQSIGHINNLQTCITEKTILRHNSGDENLIEKCCFDPASFSGASESVRYYLGFALALLALVWW